MTTTRKIAVLAVLVAAAVLAAFGGGWKWGDGRGGHRIAGWAWGDDAATLIDASGPGTTPAPPAQAAPQAQAAPENSG